MTGNRFRRLTLVLGALVVLVGCSALTGWLFDVAILKSLVPGTVTVKVNSAVSFVLSGASLLLQSEQKSSGKHRNSARACALVVTAVGFLTLLEHTLHVDFGIDQLLMHAPHGELNTASPGRMAPNTALSFVLAGLALVLIDAKLPALRVAAQLLSLAVLIIGFVAVTGYLLSVAALYEVAGYISMAIPTATGLTVLPAGILLSRPDRGVVSILAQDNPAGVTARRLAPLILVVPLAVGWLQLKGQHAGFYGAEFGLALTITICTGIFVSLALWSARVQGSSDEQRKHASEQFRLAIEAAPTGMLMVDGHGTIVLVNAQIERLFGYQREELLQRPIEMLVPERLRRQHAEHRSGFLRHPANRPMGKGGELHGRCKDGQEFPIEIGLNPLETSEGTFLLSSVVDITERKRAERERESLLMQLKDLNTVLERRVQDRTADLSATLREREVLLQEVHHRVKNNLHVIVSLMEMQARLLQEGEGRHALEECQGRVHAIALIHEKLYHSKNYADIPLADYLRGLAGDVFHATGVSPSNVSLDLAVDDVSVTIEKAIPCGLIMNELITNALKHAFPNDRRGTVRVAWQKAGGAVRLVVADDGVGLPPGFDIRATKSLGLRLVGTLVEQLSGKLVVGGEGGTSFELTFPMEEEMT